MSLIPPNINNILNPPKKLKVKKEAEVKQELTENWNPKNTRNTNNNYCNSTQHNILEKDRRRAVFPSINQPPNTLKVSDDFSTQNCP